MKATDRYMRTNHLTSGKIMVGEDRLGFIENGSDATDMTSTNQRHKTKDIMIGRENRMEEKDYRVKR